jgi:hypothetical protein
LACDQARWVALKLDDRTDEIKERIDASPYGFVSWHTKRQQIV